MPFVGDDWAEDHHDIEIVDERGKVLPVDDYPMAWSGAHAARGRLDPGAVPVRSKWWPGGELGHDMSATLSARLLRVVEALPLSPGVRVLEIGGAPGASVVEVARRVALTGHVLVLDRSPTGIQKGCCNDRLSSPSTAGRVSRTTGLGQVSARPVIADTSCLHLYKRSLVVA